MNETTYDEILKLYNEGDFDLFDFSRTDEEMERLRQATTPVETGTPPQAPDDAQDCDVP